MALRASNLALSIGRIANVLGNLFILLPWRTLLLLGNTLIWIPGVDPQMPLTITSLALILSEPAKILESIRTLGQTSREWQQEAKQAREALRNRGANQRWVANEVAKAPIKKGATFGEDPVRPLHIKTHRPRQVTLIHAGRKQPVYVKCAGRRSVVKHSQEETHHLVMSWDNHRASQMLGQKNVEILQDSSQ